MTPWSGPFLIGAAAVLVVLASWYPDESAFLPAGSFAGLVGVVLGFRLRGARIGLALLAAALPLVWISQFVGHQLFGQRLESCGGDYLRLVDKERLGVVVRPESWESACPVPVHVVKNQQEGLVYVAIQPSHSPRARLFHFEGSPPEGGVFEGRCPRRISEGWYIGGMCAEK